MKFVIFFDLHSIRLSSSYDLRMRFGRVAQVCLGRFLLFLSIFSFKIQFFLILSFVFFFFTLCLLLDYLIFMTYSQVFAMLSEFASTLFFYNFLFNDFFFILSFYIWILMIGNSYFFNFVSIP